MDDAVEKAKTNEDASPGIDGADGEKTTVDNNQGHVNGSGEVTINKNDDVEIKKFPGEPMKTAAEVNEADAPYPSYFRSSELFEEVRQTLLNGTSGDMIRDAAIRKIKGVFAVHVKPDGNGTTMGHWVIKLNLGGKGSIHYYESDPKLPKDLPKADVSVFIRDGVIMQIMTGSLDVTKAFLKGLFKVKGNLGLAMKIRHVLPKPGTLLLKAKL